MKCNILKSLGSVIAVSACLMVTSRITYAQVNADLELIVSVPSNNQVIPFGDTLHTTMLIINHGPDPIIDDTLFIRNNLFPVNGAYIGDIPVGDTGVSHGIIQWGGPENTNNDTISLCYYFPDEVSISNDVTDNNANNDTACVSYVMLGNSNNTGITDLNVHASLKLYPNPVEASVLHLNTSRVMQVGLYNQLGVCLGNYTLKVGENTIDISALPAGLYWMRYAEISQKFVIIR